MRGPTAPEEVAPAWKIAGPSYRRYGWSPASRQPLGNQTGADGFSALPDESGAGLREELEDVVSLLRRGALVVGIDDLAVLDQVGLAAGH